MSVNDQRREKASVLFKVEGTASENSRTFIFGDEDHTLGNSLRHVLMQQKETEFCGYSVPHPYEPSMNVRLQTKEGGPTAIEVLKQGCQDLEKCADLISETFKDALKNYNEKK